MTSTAIGKIKDAKWFLVNAQGQTLGRLAVKIATILMGKHQPTYTRHVMSGDHVVVINAEQVKVTGNKMQAKTYKRFSGYPGGLKEMKLERAFQKHPTLPLRNAVKGMLPKSHLGNKMLMRLHVYAGSTHSHEAQNPQNLEL